MLGYNMFAYCNNNPVNFIDSSGYLPYESNIASDRVMTCDASNRRFHTVVIVTPTEPIGKDVITWFVNTCNTMWDAYVHSNELQVQQQYQQDMAVKEHWDDVFSSPKRLNEYLGMVVTDISAYASYVTLATASTVTFWPVAGCALAVGGAIATTLNYYGFIDIPNTWEDFWR